MTSTLSYDFDMLGWHVFVLKSVVIPTIYIETHESWWVFTWGSDPFSWYKDGVLVSSGSFPAISQAQLDSDYASGDGLNYVIKNGKTSWNIGLAFNTTLYSSPSEAWNDMAIVFNLDFADRNTSINALNLISMLFTANLPEVDPFISKLIAFPIWACIAYMCFIFVLRVVGAVFGGGGA
jgi:hypothetical protein